MMLFYTFGFRGSRKPWCTGPATIPSQHNMEVRMPALPRYARHAVKVQTQKNDLRHHRRSLLPGRSINIPPREFSSHSSLSLRQEFPCPDNITNNNEYNNRSCEDAEDITRQNPSSFIWIQEAVCIEPLSFVCDVCEGKIQGEDEDERHDVGPWWR